jgi:hypothetical protein
MYGISGNSVEKKKDSLSELKKKESEAIRLLSTDEKKGLMELPIKVRNRVKEMIKKEERDWEKEIVGNRQKQYSDVLDAPLTYTYIQQIYRYQKGRV